MAKYPPMTNIASVNHDKHVGTTALQIQFYHLNELIK